MTDYGKIICSERTAKMDSPQVTTKMCNVHNHKRRMKAGLMEEKMNRKPCSTLVKSLIVAVALLVTCCVVLLNLYLIERAKKPKAATGEQLLNSSLRTPKQHSYYGGSCWSTDCLHAASGKSVRKYSKSSRKCTNSVTQCHFDENAVHYTAV